MGKDILENNTEKKLKNIKVFLSLFSLSVAIICKSEIDWERISNLTISISILKEIIYDLSIGVFSAMILIWSIDEITERNNRREQKKSLSVLYNKIIPPLKDYYEFYVKLYIATKEEKVAENDTVLKSLFNDKANFIMHVIKAEPFYKEGFYADGSIDFIEYIKANKEPPKSLPWYRCWTIDNQKFTKIIRQLEQDFVFLFSSDLLKKLEVVLNLIEPINNMTNFIEMKYQLSIEVIPRQKIFLPIEFFIEENKLVAILDSLEDLMKFVQKESGEDILSIDMKDINDRHVSPILADALK